jgi:hypothetical protein
MRLFGHVSLVDSPFELRGHWDACKSVCTIVPIACILDLIRQWTCHLTEVVLTITTLSVLPGAGWR